MSWIRPSAAHEPRASRASEAILANVHRGLLLASASRRLQDSISSQRASAEAHHLLTTAKKLRVRRLRTSASASRSHRWRGHWNPMRAS